MTSWGSENYNKKSLCYFFDAVKSNFEDKNVFPPNFGLKTHNFSKNNVPHWPFVPYVRCRLELFASYLFAPRHCKISETIFFSNKMKLKKWGSFCDVLRYIYQWSTEKMYQLSSSCFAHWSSRFSQPPPLPPLSCFLFHYPHLRSQQANLNSIIFTLIAS